MKRTIVAYVVAALLAVVATGSLYFSWSVQAKYPAATPIPLIIDATNRNFLPYIVKQEPPTATLTPTPTATSTNTPEPPTPTPTEMPTLTPTPMPTLSPGVIVLSSNTLIPYSGSTSLYLVGEVLNNTPSNVRFVRINATLRDSAGNVVDSSSSYATIDNLTPGMKSPFLVLFSDSPAWTSYDLTVTWDTTTVAPYVLELLNTQAYFDRYDGYHVVGEIRNQYSEPRNFVQAVVTLYDFEGKVIGVDYTFTNPYDLNPGQTASFDVEVYFWKYKPDRSKVAGHMLQIVDD